MTKVLKDFAVMQLAVLMPDFDFINRWKLKLRPAEVVVLTALADNAAINLSQLPAYKAKANPYYVHICRLRKKLPRGVTIDNEWGGVYSLSQKSKQILKRYERGSVSEK